jgi:hypothetical protein
VTLCLSKHSINSQVAMDVTSGQFDSTRQATRPIMLSSMDWRVWFLGYGLGGCCGLSLFAGIWSLLVDDNWSLGLISLVISLTHACLLAVFWLRRTTTMARSATRICYLAGAFGIALVALLMTSGDSRVPALGSLYSLALMSLIFAFTVPLLIQPTSGRTKP